MRHTNRDPSITRRAAMFAMGCVVRLWLLLGLCGFNAHALEEAVWEIAEPKPCPTPLSLYQSVLHDQGTTRDIAQVLERLEDFEPNRAGVPSFGYTQNTVWSSLRVRCAAAEQVNLVLRLGTSRLSYVTWYLLDESGKVLQVKAAGAADVTLAGERVPMFRFSLQPGEERRVLLGVSSDTSVWLPMEGGDEDLMEFAELRHVTVDTLMLGFCGAIMAFMLLMAWIQRSRLHLYLAAVIVCYMLYFSIFQGYVCMLWPQAPFWVERELLASAIGIAMVTFALYNREFLKAKGETLFQGVLHVLAFVLPLGSLACVALCEYAQGIRVVNYVTLVSVLLSMTSSFLAKGLQSDQRWYVAAWVLLASVMSLMVLQFSHVIPVWIPFRYLQLATAPALLLGFFIAALMRMQAKAVMHQQREVEKKAHEVISNIAAGTYEVSLHPRKDGSIEPRFHFVSAQFLKMFDITVEEMNADPDAIYQRIHPDDRLSLQEANTRAIAEQSQFRWEGRMLWNGVVTWIQAAGGPRINSDGIVSWTGLITDITPQKKAQESLRSILENLPMAVACDSMEDPPMITMLNEQFVKTFGYSHEEIPAVADWAIRAYPDPNYREEVMSWWFEAVERAKREQGDIESRELKVRCKDGTDKEVIITTTMLEDSMVVAFLDITERNRTARELEDLRRSREKSAYELTENMPAGAYTLIQFKTDHGEIGFQFRFASRRVLDFYHVTREQLMEDSRCILKSIHPDDRESLMIANINAYQSTEPFHWEGRTLVDERVRWISIQGNPRIDVDGQTIWEGLVNDITPLKKAQESLRSILENLPNAIACCSKEDSPVITMLNEQFVKTFGYSHEEIPSLADWATLAYPDPIYREEVMSWWFGAVERAKSERGNIESRELKVRCKDGTDKEVIFSATVLEDSMVAAFLDITERNRTARELEALRRSHEKSAYELTENMPAGSYTLTHEKVENGEIGFRFRFASRRFLEFFDVTREQLMDDSSIVFQSIHPDDRESLARGDLRARETEVPFYWQGRTCVNGSVRWISIQSNPRVDADGQTIWEGVVNDITTLIETSRKLEESLVNEKRLREEAEQLRKDAEKAHQAKSLFLAKMSHEIRTPLSALVSLSQAMWMRGQQQAIDSEFTPFLNRVRSGGQYLNLLLRNVMNISAAESGRVPVKPEEFYVADWVAEIRNILEPIAEYYRGSIEWVMPADDEARWSTDQMRLTQIALNLCENALKFSLGANQPVRMSIDVVHDQLRIVVEDGGPGIPHDKQELVFAAFSQADGKVSPLDEGVGLGLSVVKINVELLEGEVTVENLDPSGTKFTVLCPRMNHGAGSSDSDVVKSDERR